MVTTPFDPYATATSALPSATQNQVPGGIIGLSSVTINTSQMNFASNANGGMFGYSGAPGSGNLYFAFAPVGGTDTYGNTYSTGINVQAGQLQGVSILGASVDSSSVLYGSSLQGPQILTPTVSGGTAAALVHTMTNANGQVLGYTIGSTAVTFATNGFYQWTVPTGVTSVRVQCWAAGAGGGGGGGTAVQGGESGGAGEYAEEPSYAVLPGQVYVIIVGQGGQGSATGFAGFPGSTSSFAALFGAGNNLQVLADGGNAGANFQGGAGGSGSNNTIHFNGGNGASADGNTGGAGGGGAAGPTSQGNPGLQATGNAGAGGGAAVPGGGAGGAGGNLGSSGANGTGPGGGGGGGGYEAFGGSSNTYTPDHGTYSYNGPDSPAFSNGLRNHDGPMYQGFVAGGGNGDQYSYMTLPYAKIQSDLALVNITSVALRIHNLHSFYSSGMYVIMRYSTVATFGTFGDGGQGVGVANFLIKQGATITQNVGLGGSIGVALQNGNAKSILFGPQTPGQGQAAYGYFDSGANNGVVPELIVYYGGVVNAGNGADGQVILTYGSGTVPTFQLSVSALATQDVFGHTIPTGFAGPLLTLANNAVPPSANPAAAAINANTAGSPTVTNSQGVTGQLPITQVDATPFTVTQTTFTALSKAWTIPVNDAQAGTMYRLTVFGNGISGNPAQTMRTTMNAFGAASSATIIIGQTFLSTVTNFSWNVTGYVMITNTGGAGSMRTNMVQDISVFGAALLPTTGAQASGGFVGQNNSTAINTAIANTIQLQLKWDANTGTAPTISSFGSILERLGT